MPACYRHGTALLSATHDAKPCDSRRTCLRLTTRSPATHDVMVNDSRPVGLRLTTCFLKQGEPCGL